jgi:hypothetical protein
MPLANRATGASLVSAGKAEVARRRASYSPTARALAMASARVSTPSLAKIVEM